MTAIETFIKDAIEGGWNPIPEYLMPWMKTLNDTGITMSGGEGDNRRYTIHQILLDKDAWIAVGKTRGWSPYGTCRDCGEAACIKDYCGNTAYSSQSLFKWHQFIDHLADGKTLEQSLSERDKAD